MINKHTDRHHTHLHIVANMVNNDGKTITDNYIGLRGKKISQQLTLKHQLIQALEKDLKLTNLESLNEEQAHRYKIYMTVAEQLPHCRSMEELENRLSKLKIEMQYKYKGQTNEKQGVSFKMGKYCFKGSEIDHKFSFGNLQKTIALNQKQELKHTSETQSAATENRKPAIKFTLKQRTKTKVGKDEGHKQLSDKTKSLMEMLIKPEQTDEQLPYELMQQGYQRKLKKRSPRHKH